MRQAVRFCRHGIKPGHSWFGSPLSLSRHITVCSVRPGVEPRVCSAAEAVKVISSGDRVFVHTAASAPTTLLDAMVGRADELRGVEVVHAHIEGRAPHAAPEVAQSFHVVCPFVGTNVRAAVRQGRAGYIPIHLYEVPRLWETVLPLDVALVQVSPPDAHGFCTLGPSVDVTLSAMVQAKHVIALVNPRVPRTHGDGHVHVSNLDAMVYHDEPLPQHAAPSVDNVSPVLQRIGENVAALVENGATLQMGIGAVPDAVLAQLGGHKRLGIHSEMFSDGVQKLYEEGIITGEEKAVERHQISVGFSVGSQNLYDFLDDNLAVRFRTMDYINNPAIISRNPKVTAINSALEVDLTGQVCADSIGALVYSGVGGQVDFMRGAAASVGGKPIIAMPSVTSSGVSRIVPFLKRGAGVVTTRALVHYVITEYGVANLWGKTVTQRAHELIAIAHPDHREELTRLLQTSYWQYWDQPDDLFAARHAIHARSEAVIMLNKAKHSVFEWNAAAASLFRLPEARPPCSWDGSNNAKVTPLPLATVVKHDALAARWIDELNECAASDGHCMLFDVRMEHQTLGASAKFFRSINGDYWTIAFTQL